MAKWGKGDPRWIVEERPDATNVNNWHWTEKNATPWSKQRLRELLEGLKIDSDKGSCKITEIKSCEGEATANNRKAKLIFFYEWVIKCSWTGKLLNNDEEFKGSLEIPNLSDENTADEVDVNVSADSSSDEAYTLKEIVRLTGIGVIREALDRYDKELRQEFSQGMILPTTGLCGKSQQTTDTDKESDKPRSEQGSRAIRDATNDQKQKHDAGSRESGSGVTLPVKTINLKSSFKCSPDDLYRALTIPEMVMAFTNGPVTLEAKRNGRFVLYGGMVEGRFIDLVPNQSLKMDWRMKTWPSDHYSSVTLTFEKGEDCTELIVKQTGVPEAHKDATEQGWERHYFEAMKRTFGFHAYLL